MSRPTGLSGPRTRRAGPHELCRMGRLAATMETTAPPRRRSLPPVPRSAAEPPTAAVAARKSPRRRPVKDQPDAAQRFVARLRAAAPAFARAAGADTAVVPECVPPARHRRSRCRVVLRDGDGAELDVTFLGPAAGPRGLLPAGFDEQIEEWLRAGQPRDPDWLVVDRDATGGVAIDLTAWSAGR